MFIEDTGRPQTAYNAKNKHYVKEHLVIDWCIKLKDIAYTLNLTKTFVYQIVHNALGYQSLPNGCPKNDLHQKAQWKFLNNLLHYRNELDFLNSIITGDETWIHHKISEDKETQWYRNIQDLQLRKNSRQQHLFVKLRQCSGMRNDCCLLILFRK